MIQLPKPVKILTAALLSLVLFILVLISLIRSPIVLKRILPPIQQKIAQDFNVKTKITGLSIDPFARIALEGVEAEWTDPTLGQAKIELGRMLVRFSFWELLKRNLQVSEVELVSPHINAVLTLPAQSKQTPPTNPLPLIRQLILNPPAQVNLNSLSVLDLNLDAELRQGKMSTKIKLTGVNAFADLELNDKKLHAGVKLKLANGQESSEEATRLLFESKNSSPSVPFVHLDGVLRTEIKSELELSFQDSSAPYFSLSETNAEVLAQKLQLTAKLEKAGTAQVSLKEFKVSNTSLSQIRFDLASLFELEKLSGEQFQAQVAEKALELVKNFSGTLSSSVTLTDLGAQLRLPSNGMDATVRVSSEIPLKLMLNPKEIVFNTRGKSFSVRLDELVLKGTAFKALSESVKLEHLRGFKIDTPVDVKMIPPSLKSLKKPLQGARLAELEFEPQLQWGQPTEKFLSAKVSVKQSPVGQLALQLGSDVILKERLLKLVPSLKPVYDSFGQLQLRAEISSVVATQWKDLQDAADVVLAGVRQVGVNYKVDLQQLTSPVKDSPTGFQLPGGLKIQGRVDLPDPAKLKEIKATTNVDWAGAPLLKNQITVSNLPRRLVALGETEIAALLRLRKITPLAAQMGLLGGTNIAAQWKISLPHEAETILRAKIPQPKMLNADFEVDATLQFSEKPVLPLFDKNMLQIAGPLKAKVKGGLKRGDVKVSIDYALPKVGVTSLAMVDALAGQLNAQSRVDLAGGVELGVQASVGQLTPAKSFGLPEEVDPYLKDISAQMSLRSDVKSRVDIRSGTVTTGKDKFKVDFRGGSDLKATNSRLEGQLAVKPPKVFRYGIRAQDKVALDGSLQVGWELTQRDQKSLRLRGEASLENFSAQHKLGGLKNANGKVPFQQDLELPNFKSLKWSYLIQDNPFKRVDASKFVPLMTDDSMLVIDELNALEKKFGPLRGRFSLKQNMLTIDRLDADLFEGVLAGQGFVDIQPSRLVAGLQGRVTKINTALLAANPQKAPPGTLSARLATVVDLSKALVEGRVDVTEIGKNQLLAMMDLLDPTGADALLNKARLALSVGYPTYVGLQMAQGFLDLEVGLGGVISQQFKIPNLPLSPIINAKTQDLVKTLREVPIQ